MTLTEIVCRIGLVILLFGFYAYCALFISRTTYRPDPDENERR